MSHAHLQQTLKKLRDELAAGPKLDDKDRALLSTVLGDIQRTLEENAPHEPDALDKLEQAAVAVEVETPELTALIRQLAEVLRRAGI
jgi:ABC-type transporter Mla subunit MlaD